MSTFVLQARELRKTVALPGGQPLEVLRGIDLSVTTGESVAVMGRSGSGKSTLLALLGLLTSVQRGSLRICDQPVDRLSDRQRAIFRNRNIGFVFQSYSLVRHMTAANNIGLALRYGSNTTRRDRARRVQDVLQAVALADRARSRPRQLSGGEQQRVAIARALVRRPSLVLADEPTGALDTQTADIVLDALFTTARDRSTALVIVTHDLQVAQRADRIVTLTDGQLVSA
ncbi:ABC transporter ATP-binding protein [Hamadaea sp. NPDC051192]|uniref:ABC transporter ATP-binding protein n=1 Tax=Hamadaea sp. NPDC051192 TaxID=3154940 RepID=UPI00341DF291